MSADFSQGGYVAADRVEAFIWEEFYLKELGERKYALRAFNGKWVALEENRMIANRDEILAWETFEMIPLGENTLALKAWNGNYVAALSDLGSGHMMAINGAIGTDETFTITPTTPTEFIPPSEGHVTLQSYAGLFVSADETLGYQLIANREVVSTWEEFYLKELDEGKYALQAWNGKWVAFEDGDDGDNVVGNRDEISLWERFEMIPIGTNTFALKTWNGAYVSPNSQEGGRLLRSGAIGTNETFTITPTTP